MNKRFVGVLMFAFVVAGRRRLITYRSLIGRPQPAKAAAPTVQIVLAAKDLEVGTVLKEDDVQLADWPGAVPAGATNKAQDLVGRGVITPIYAKEPMIESRLAPKGAGGGLAAMIPPGMRAVAVSVNEVVGVAGFVRAGHARRRADLRQQPGGNGSPRHAQQNAAAEPRSALRRPGFQERIRKASRCRCRWSTCW